MTAAFPHQYRVELASPHARRGVVRTNAAPPLEVGPPPQFDGRAEDWSPEDLLLASVAVCLMTTFASIAERKALSTGSYSCVAEGTVAKTAQGLRFTEIRLHVRVSGDDKLRLAEALALSEKHCIVSNALAVPVKVQVEIVPAAA